MKSCGFTGHRRVPDEKTLYVREGMLREIQLAVSDGYTHFISGFAEGCDLEFAALVASVRESNPAITLEAAIPFRGRLKTADPLFKSLIAVCDKVSVVREEYAPDCYKARNTYIVENSERLIAVFDGRFRSGTAQTIRIAERLGREIKVIGI